MKWEYKTLQLKLSTGFLSGKVDASTQDEVLNQYGRQGWELVNCYNYRTTGGTSCAMAVMKKPLG
jgi:hypothetical protein